MAEEERLDGISSNPYIYNLRLHSLNMALTQNEIKFLTILNETRLANGKMFGRYSEEIKKQFNFSDKELIVAVRKLEELNLLTKINAGGNEYVYFHTDKVVKTELDKELSKIRH